MLVTSSLPSSIWTISREPSDRFKWAAEKRGLSELCTFQTRDILPAIDLCQACWGGKDQTKTTNKPEKIPSVASAAPSQNIWALHQNSSCSDLTQKNHQWLNPFDISECSIFGIRRCNVKRCQECKSWLQQPWVRLREASYLETSTTLEANIMLIPKKKLSHKKWGKFTRIKTDFFYIYTVVSIFRFQN